MNEEYQPCIINGIMTLLLPVVQGQYAAVLLN